jgi:hypothetical protein
MTPEEIEAAIEAYQLLEPVAMKAIADLIEIEAAIEAYQLLEPVAMKAIADLIGKIHKKQLTAQDFLDMAAKLVPQP